MRISELPGHPAAFTCQTGFDIESSSDSLANQLPIVSFHVLEYHQRPAASPLCNNHGILFLILRTDDKMAPNKIIIDTDPVSVMAG
jgi:hypothetical protein